MYKLQLDLPFIPISLNQLLRMHYHAANKYKKEVYRVVWLLTQNKRPSRPLIKCRLTFIRKSYRLLDWDGAVGSLKVIVDGLVNSKILKDDTYTITGDWNVSQEFLSKKKGKGYICVLIEEI